MYIRRRVGLLLRSNKYALFALHSHVNLLLKYSRNEDKSGQSHRSFQRRSLVWGIVVLAVVLFPSESIGIAQPTHTHYFLKKFSFIPRRKREIVEKERSESSGTRTAPAAKAAV